MGLTQTHLKRRATKVSFSTITEGTLSRSKTHRPYRVALLIPMCGAAGMWAPSCIASAEVALNELNAHAGIAGRPVEVVAMDSAIEALTPVETLIDDLIDKQAIDAIVGMHISAVRQKIIRSVRGRIPFVYTPLYEGGETSPGVYAIGDTPARQLGPAIRYMSRTFKLRKWALIGNDYVWPRVSHAYAKRQFRLHGGELVYETYLPFSSKQLPEAVETIGRSGADAVLMSLVGQDAVTFNRLFGALGLHAKMFRLSCAIEENGLLASGARNLDRLFSSASYFAGLQTTQNAEFREKYHSLHRDRAPMLNALGQSTYEGLHFLAGLIKSPDGNWSDSKANLCRPISYKSARGGSFTTATQTTSPVYLARANGFVFDDLQQLPPT